MQRRTFIKNSSFAFSAFLLFKDKAFAQLVQDYKMRMLTDDIGIFTESGGTILFYLSKDGMVIVDSQFPENASHLITELNKKGLPYHILINTHHHGDHTGGNISFKGIVPHVLAHENAKKNLENIAEQKGTKDKQLFPDQTFSTTWCEKIGKEEVCANYYGPGHTNGDAVISFKKAKIVHVGDLVFNRKHPYIDKPMGASISNWIKILDQLISSSSKKTKFVCGHAADGYDVVISKNDITAFRDYLRNLLLFVSSQISAGKSSKEILKATEIPGSPEWKGEGIERPLDAAYTELTEKFD